MAGAVAFEFSNRRLARRFASFRVSNLPIRRARLLGDTPNLPAQEAAHDLLFQRLPSLKFDTIYMTCIRTDSFFWHYIHSSPLIRSHFCLYSEAGLRPHPYLRMTGSFDHYMRRLSSKDRNNYCISHNIVTSVSICASLSAWEIQPECEETLSPWNDGAGGRRGCWPRA